MSSPREAHLVELVNENGRAVGESTVEAAHQLPGQLHRAFSVLLVNPAGRILLQQRAAVKTRFPLRWANACCGHPAPGQSSAAAARLRLSEEIGVVAGELTEIGVHVYRAEDPETGRVEFEYDHVLRGELSPDAALRPDPAEVADLRWAELTEVRADLVANPQRYAPWFGGVLDQLTGHQPDATGGPATVAGNGSEWSGGR
jgi:isopentenyl-diphosphate delta-isomerase